MLSFLIVCVRYFLYLFVLNRIFAKRVQSYEKKRNICPFPYYIYMKSFTYFYFCSKQQVFSSICYYST